MANAADQVVVGANGNVWVAAPATAAPTDSDTALAAGWVNLGFISEDGATFTEGKSVTDIGAWQSFYPIRRIITDRTVAVHFSLRQWSQPTVEFALGGQVSTNGAGEFKYEPPSPELFDERSLVLEWLDGTKNYRLYIPTGIVSESVETHFVRTSAADLPVTFAAADPGAGLKVYTIFTDDASMAATS